MSEICIPIPNLHGGQNAMVKVETPETGNSYKIEVFVCKNPGDNTINTPDIVFNTLKDKLENYDKGWELLQVFAPEGENNEVKVLFRKR